MSGYTNNKPPKGTLAATMGEDNNDQTNGTKSVSGGSVSVAETITNQPTTQSEVAADPTGLGSVIDQLKAAREKYKDPYADLSDDEREKAERKRLRREKAKRSIGALGDGLRALSNLFFTTQYAPNMYTYNKETSMHQNAIAQQERMKKEREANHDKYMNYSMKIGELENQRGKTLRDMRQQALEAKLAQEKNDREAEAHGWSRDKQPEEMRKLTGEANAAESNAITKGVEAQNAPAMAQAKQQTEEARRLSYIASANEHNANASKGDQDEYTVSVKEEPETDMFGKPVIGSDGKPKMKTTTTTTTKQKGNKKRNPMGGSGKKSNPMSN